MPTEDAIRWNSRYKEAPKKWHSSPRSFLVENINLFPTTGRALDIAMGPGSNAGELLRHGLDVYGVDISSEAVYSAKESYPNLKAVIGDMTRFYIPDHYFDVILNFYYLQRNLWPEFRRILKPHGIVVIETLTQMARTDRPDISPQFLLSENELANAFKDWEVLVYRQGTFPSDHGFNKSIASIIARLPVE
ncbi:MAG: methyltransferase domain-containing protein [Anaerolineaceae bacterium]|nr:methyltransferase domain-containing protein [Anaerolineaceae bacterium]